MANDGVDMIRTVQKMKRHQQIIRIDHNDSDNDINVDQKNDRIWSIDNDQNVINSDIFAEYLKANTKDDSYEDDSNDGCRDSVIIEKIWINGR